MSVPEPTHVSQVDHERDTPTILDTTDAWKAVGAVLIDMIVNGDRPLDPTTSTPIESGDIQVLEDYINNNARGTGYTGPLPIITFPKHRLNTFRIEQSSWTEFVLRFPYNLIGQAGHDRVCDSNGNELPSGDYEEPPFYEERINVPPPQPVNKCDFFKCRVADYTMSMCK